MHLFFESSVSFLGPISKAEPHILIIWMALSCSKVSKHKVWTRYTLADGQSYSLVLEISYFNLCMMVKFLFHPVWNHFLLSPKKKMNVKFPLVHHLIIRLLKIQISEINFSKEIMVCCTRYMLINCKTISYYW